MCCAAAVPAYKLALLPTCSACPLCRARTKVQLRCFVLLCLFCFSFVLAGPRAADVPRDDSRDFWCARHSAAERQRTAEREEPKTTAFLPRGKTTPLQPAVVWGAPACFETPLLACLLLSTTTIIISDDAYSLSYIINSCSNDPFTHHHSIAHRFLPSVVVSY